jgi:hypothetical protein
LWHGVGEYLFAVFTQIGWSGAVCSIFAYFLVWVNSRKLLFKVWMLGTGEDKSQIAPTMTKEMAHSYYSRTYKVWFFDNLSCSNSIASKQLFCFKIGLAKKRMCRNLIQL